MKDEDVAGALRKLIAGQPEQLAERMGIVITEISAGRVAGAMPVEGNRQPYGLLHGGALCVLAETLGSIAGALHAGPERAAVGVDMNATYHRALRAGLVTGVCTPLHQGRTIASYEIVLTDDLGRRVATARLTCSLLDRPPGAARGQGG